jgi:hypothetical protein
MPEMTIICWRRVSSFLLWIVVVIAVTPPLRAQSGSAEPTAHSSIRVGGFADAELHTSSDNAREGLDLAELDLYSSASLSQRWSALAEVVAQRTIHKQTDGEAVFELNLERLYASYSPSDAFTLELGQTHTGIVRWNEREHRSRILQTPIDVPAIARRPQDDGVWPLRFIGGWMSGRLPGSLSLGYGAGVGVGPEESAREEAAPLNRSRTPAGLLSLSIAPDALGGLELAIAAYAQHIPAQPAALRERDITLSLNYVERGTEVRAEWARMTHEVISRPTVYRNTGYYLLVSKRLAGRAARARPYFLLDRLQIAQGEVLLQKVQPESAWATGIRYDLSPHLSIKGEYRSQRAPDGGRENLLGLQVGLSF